MYVDEIKEIARTDGTGMTELRKIGGIKEGEKRCDWHVMDTAYSRQQQF